MERLFGEKQVTFLLRWMSSKMRNECVYEKVGQKFRDKMREKVRQDCMSLGNQD